MNIRNDQYAKVAVWSVVLVMLRLLIIPAIITASLVNREVGYIYLCDYFQVPCEWY